MTDVAGDLYDFVSYSMSRTAIVIGDVSGKGAPAAIYAALVSGILRSHAPIEPGPAEMLSAVNFSLGERRIESQFVSLIYAGAMVTLFLHLSHGIQSMFQTFGLSNDKVLPVLVKAGTLVALVLFLGYVAVPLMIFLNILK